MILVCLLKASWIFVECSFHIVRFCVCVCVVLVVTWTVLFSVWQQTIHMYSLVIQCTVFFAHFCCCSTFVSPNVVQHIGFFFSRWLMRPDMFSLLHCCCYYYCFYCWRCCSYCLWFGLYPVTLWFCVVLDCNEKYVAYRT